MLRIASVIRAVLAEAIRERLSDPRIETLTSITNVEVSADMSVARVHVSVMAPAARQRLTLAALQHASGRLRSLVARRLTVRQTPQITFHLDESLQRGFETVQQIDKLMGELHGTPPDETPVGEGVDHAEAGGSCLAAAEATGRDGRDNRDGVGRGAAEGVQRDAGREDT